MRRATPDDAAFLAPRLRATDCMEVSASFADIEAGLRAAIAASEICDVGEIDGVPAFVIGCADNGDGTGAPWLLGTDALAPVPGALTKTTKAYVQRFLQRWPVLRNYVDVRSAKSVSWLRLLGFTMHPPEARGLHGEFFLPFTMKA